MLAVVAAIVIEIARTFRAGRRRAAVLGSDRPGALSNDRAPRRRNVPSRITVHHDLVTVFDERNDAHIALGSAGLDVRSDTESAALPWDRFHDGVAPLPGTWIVRVDVIDADIVALVVVWDRAAASLSDNDGPRELSLVGKWDDADWACFHALVRLLARLVHDIGAFNPLLPPQRFGGVRRQRLEIDTAMKQAGFVHELSRPLPDWVIPPLDDTVAQVRARLAANPHARGDTIADDELVEHVRLNFLDTDPWPFQRCSTSEQVALSRRRKASATRSSDAALPMR